MLLLELVCLQQHHGNMLSALVHIPLEVDNTVWNAQDVTNWSEVILSNKFNVIMRPTRTEMKYTHKPRQHCVDEGYLEFGKGVSMNSTMSIHKTSTMSPCTNTFLSGFKAIPLHSWKQNRFGQRLVNLISYWTTTVSVSLNSPSIQ